jgi:hypothetical protein
MCRELKRLFAQRDFKNPHQEKVSGVRAVYEYRKVPAARLAAGLGLSGYSEPVEGPLEVKDPPRVRVPLSEHLGPPSSPVVEPGEEVGVGDLVAAAGEGPTGVPYHAPISGGVGEVDHRFVTIYRKHGGESL